MRKLNLTILVGLVVAVLGFALVFAYGSRVDSRVAEGRESVPVLVATATAAAGLTPAELTGMLEVRQVPKLYVADGALATLDDVQGQVLLAPLGVGGQLTAVQFGAPGVAGAVKPEPGRVALAVGVSLTPGVARYVTPGSSVDVFVTYTAGTEANAGRTKLFASGVKVLSVSVAEAVDAAESGDAPPADGGQVVAVLDLLPGDAEKVVNAATLGSLYLALASTTNGVETHLTPGATADDVVGSNR